MNDPGMFEIMYSLRSMRRLKPDPIPPEILEKLLNAGVQAPSGQNTQPWAFLVVQDSTKKKFIQVRYHQGILKRFGDLVPRMEGVDTPDARSFRAALHLAEHMHEAPVLLIVCGKRDWPAQTKPEHRTGKAPPNYGAVYPCVQNILLACRALGLGASLTTTHRLFEDEIASEFDVPDDFGMVVLIPIGYPKGKFGPVSRTPVEDLTHYDRWGNRNALG